MLSSLILCNNNEPFLERIVTCDKWILYDNQQWPAQWLDWEEAPKHFPKPNLHQEKVIVTGGLLPIWSTTAFWILVKPLYLRSMISKLRKCTENWNACSQLLDNRKGPVLLQDNAQPHMTQLTLQKRNELFKVLPRSPYQPDFYHVHKHSDNLLRGKYFHNPQRAENAFQEFIEFWNIDFYATGINTPLSG